MAARIAISLPWVKTWPGRRPTSTASAGHRSPVRAGTVRTVAWPLILPRRSTAMSTAPTPDNPQDWAFETRQIHTGQPVDSDTGARALPQGRELLRILRQTSVQSVPIIILVNFLVGAILAFIGGVRRGFGFARAEASTVREIAAAVAYFSIAGLALVFTPGIVDWSLAWPWTKAAGVIGMTLFHHWLMIQRRKLQRGAGLSGRQYRIMNEVPTILMVLIVVSVIVGLLAIVAISYRQTIEAYPNGNVYNASKYGVNGLTQGMRMDLISHNIKVSEIKPGLVQTEFSEVRFKGDQEKAEKVYQGYDPLQAQDIAETIEFILSRPAHVNIADMLVLAGSQASATMVNKKS